MDIIAMSNLLLDELDEQQKMVIHTKDDEDLIFTSQVGILYAAKWHKRENGSAWLAGFNIIALADGEEVLLGTYDDMTQLKNALSELFAAFADNKKEFAMPEYEDGDDEC